MFNNFKARLRKWADLGHEDFFRLIQWGASCVQFDNRTLVASASRDGQTVAYLVTEPVFMVHSYAANPQTAPLDLHWAGDAIDSAIEAEAQRVGAHRLLIVLPANAPKQADEIALRVIDRIIPQAAEQHQRVSERLLDDANHPITTAWIN